MERALDFFVQQIHVNWLNKDEVPTLLSLDVSGTFDRVVLGWQLHNMRERKLSKWIVKCVGSFISNRTTALYLPGNINNAFPTYTRVPQGSPLSPFLFLFYNAHLVNACSPPPYCP